MRTTAIGAILLACLAVAACAGRGALPQAPSFAVPNAAAPAVPAAAQATDPPILHAGPTPTPTIPSAKALGLPPAIASSGRQIRLPHFLPSFGLAPMDGIKNPSTHGGGGLWLPAWNAKPLGDAYEAATVREGMQLRDPVYSEVWNILYAPTFHPPNGNCLELTTAYERITPLPHGANLGTVRHLEVYDFCRNGGGFFVEIPMDAAFVQRYVRYWSNGNKTPQYVAELIRDKDKRWDAFLYDVPTKKWDVIYRSEPGKLAYITQYGDGRAGWSAFEFYYEYGSGRVKPYPKAVPCSHLPPIGASGLRMRQANGTWVAIPQARRYIFANACVNPHETPYYHLHVSLQNPKADLSWKVRTR